MKTYFFLICILFLNACFVKNGTLTPIEPIGPVDSTDTTIADTLCTVCLEDSTEVLDTLVKADTITKVDSLPGIDTLKLRATFDNYLKQNASSYDNNVLVFVAKGNSTIYCYKQGNYNIDTKLPIMSASKPVTAAVIMTLVESNKIKLDDPVSKYIPSFKSSEKQKITIRQLFAHTSGIVADSPYDTRSDLTLAQAVDSIAVRTKLLFVPGTRASYGSASYKVASRIAEIVEGKTWAEVFQDKIGSKCDMQNVIYNSQFPLNPSTGWGIECSMKEYLGFWVMLYNKGIYKGKRVLSQNSIETMENDNTNGVEYLYGLGLFRSEVSNEIACHSAKGIQGWINRRKNYYGLMFTQAGFEKTVNSNLAFRRLVSENL